MGLITRAIYRCSLLLVVLLLFIAKSPYFRALYLENKDPDITDIAGRVLSRRRLWAHFLWPGPA